MAESNLFSLHQYFFCLLLYETPFQCPFPPNNTTNQVQMLQTMEIVCALIQFDSVYSAENIIRSQIRRSALQNRAIITSCCYTVFPFACLPVVQREQSSACLWVSVPHSRMKSQLLHTAGSSGSTKGRDAWVVNMIFPSVRSTWSSRADTSTGGIERLKCGVAAAAEDKDEEEEAAVNEVSSTCCWLNCLIWVFLLHLT